jgi:heme oxygenase
LTLSGKKAHIKGAGSPTNYFTFYKEKSRMKSLMESLKEAIGERHRRMEELPYIEALTRGDLPLNCYVAQLRAMAVIHGTLEYELGLADPTPITELYKNRPSRLSALRADLGVFDKLNIPDCLAANEHSLKIAERIRRIRLERPEDLPGFIYVLEGTTLGNTVHLPDVEKAFGDRAKGVTHYYSGYGPKTGSYWQEFRSAMNALPLENPAREGLIRSAHELFDLLEPLFSSLYPVEDRGWGFTAGMLNPEAGNHPVPGSEAEIQAAVTAAYRCLEEFPYFGERYGERGRSFAKSDAAWLASLTTLPPSRFLSQIEWLGRVLGNRGMPGITLERQLELLYRELTTAIPEGRAGYAVFKEAAEHLEAERYKTIPKQAFKNLVEGFNIAAAEEPRGRLLRAGELIVSAVCDEAAGITEAVGSLLSWIADGERFSDRWIEAVNKTVEKARDSIINPRFNRPSTF